MDSVVDICSFYIPHRHAYPEWPDYVQDMGRNIKLPVSTLPANVKDSDLGFLGLACWPTSKEMPYFYEFGYTSIWNNYFRPPTTIDKREAPLKDWTSDDRRYGFQGARLKDLWSAFAKEVPNDSDFNFSGTNNFDLRDLALSFASLRTKEQREYFTSRYRDIIDELGGYVDYDADNRPHFLMRSTFWASGYDINATDQSSIGQFVGRVNQSFRHIIPSFFVPEHGSIWTVAIVRFPNTSFSELPFFMNVAPTFENFCADPDIVANSGEWLLNTEQIFPGTNVVLGEVPFGQWYRVHPSSVHYNYRQVDGFPFVTKGPRSISEAVLVDSTEYDDVFQTMQLGHWQIQARDNVSVWRNLPSGARSLITSTDEVR